MHPSLPPWIESKQRLLPDTNLLLVLVIGSTDESLLGKKPIQNFLLPDYERLKHFIDSFSSVVTTPHILAEVSNLLNKTHAQEQCRGVLAAMIPALEEIHTGATNLSTDPAFARFGITDISIKHASTSDTLVLTNDEPLLGMLAQSNVAAIRYGDLLQ